MTTLNIIGNGVHQMKVICSARGPKCCRQGGDGECVIETKTSYEKILAAVFSMGLRAGEKTVRGPRLRKSPGPPGLYDLLKPHVTEWLSCDPASQNACWQEATRMTRPVGDPPRKLAELLLHHKSTCALGGYHGRPNGPAHL